MKQMILLHQGQDSLAEELQKVTGLSIRCPSRNLRGC